MTYQVARYGGMKLSQRVARSLPWIGAALVAVTAVSTMRRKGVISGALDTGLNAVPLVGAAKNVIEFVRGRDFFPDKYGPALPASRDRAVVPPTRRRATVPAAPGAAATTAATAR
jgi:hypothetical protein